MFVKISNSAIFAPSKDFSLVHQCPDGEIGKRCGLRSRWSTILESSSLSSGTSKLLKACKTLFCRLLLL